MRLASTPDSLAPNDGALDLGDGQQLPRVHGSLPGPRAQALCDVLADVECPALTARRARRAEQSGATHDPIVWAAARGANVVDVDGNVFVDLTAGFGAALLGHGHPAVVAAVQRQATRLIHALGDVYPSDAKVTLEARLAAIAPWPGARVILGLSGSDAVEAALKTCALATGRAGVLAFEGGYHGLSYGALAACGYKPGFAAPFREQLGSHVAFAPYPTRDDGAVERALEVLSRGHIGTVLIEPVQGRGGVRVGHAAAIDAICARAREVGALVVADEVQTGMRRASPEWLCSTGRWASAPDVVCVGKALGGGLPVSACMMRPEVAAAWARPGVGGEAIHTSTFLGNPLGCAAALATLDVLAEPATVATLGQLASRLASALAEIAREDSLGVRAVVGSHAMLGVQLEGGAARALGVTRALLEVGHIALTGGIAGDTLTLTPPMALGEAQLGHFADALRSALRARPAGATGA